MEAILKQANERTPSGEIAVFCDTYDTKLTARIHTINECNKVELIMQGSDDEGKQLIKLSLFQEDISFLASFLNQATKEITKKKNR